MDGYAESGHEVAEGIAGVEPVLVGVAKLSVVVEVSDAILVTGMGLHGFGAFGSNDAG